jgi:transposase-like protein
MSPQEIQSKKISIQYSTLIGLICAVFGWGVTYATINASVKNLKEKVEELEEFRKASQDDKVSMHEWMGRIEGKLDMALEGS